METQQNNLNNFGIQEAASEINWSIIPDDEELLQKREKLLKKHNNKLNEICNNLYYFQAEYGLQTSEMMSADNIKNIALNVMIAHNYDINTIEYAIMDILDDAITNWQSEDVDNIKSINTAYSEWRKSDDK